MSLIRNLFRNLDAQDGVCSAPDDRTYSDKSVTCVPGPCGAVCVSVQSSCVQCGLSAWFEIVAQVVTARDWGHLPFKNTGGAGTHGHTDHTITQTSTGTGEKGTGSPGTGTRTGKKTQGGAGTHVPVKRHRPVLYTLRARSTPVALTLPHSSPATDMM